jgi:carbon-monoxide dehydrogenase medium subunit
MKPVAFRYHQPPSIGDALSLLAEFSDEGRVIAGGQSLGPMLNLRVVRPSHVVDIGRIDAMRRTRSLEGGGISVGAAVTHAAIEDGTLPGRIGVIMGGVAAGIAYRSVRNRGTIGGSLAHADPAADWPTVLCALGATLRLAHVDGQRRLAASDFIRGVYENALHPGEILEAIELPDLAEGSRWGFAKETEHTGGFSIALAACAMRPNAPGALWLGAVGTQPTNLSPVLTELRTGTSAAEIEKEAYAAVRRHLNAQTVDDVSSFKIHLHATNAAAAVAKAMVS